MANSRFESNFGEMQNSRLQGRGPRTFDGQRGNYRHSEQDSAPQFGGWHANAYGWGRYNVQNAKRKQMGPRYDRKRMGGRPEGADGTNGNAAADADAEQHEEAEEPSKNAVQAEDGEDERLCPVCHNETSYFGVFVCDHAICFACATKLCVLCETRACPICRADSPAIYLVHERDSFSKLRNRNLRLFNERHKLYFEDGQVQTAYLRLLEYRCPVCTDASNDSTPENSKPVHSLSVFDTWQQLKVHLRVTHERFFCEICVTGLKLFAAERKIYTRQELAQHMKAGDADAGYRGHPLCEFCDVRYLDTDELFRHLRKDHFFCHFCDVEGSNEYYCEYAMLLEHFHAAHFVCEDDECATVQFTNVFRTALDLKAHRLASHAASMSKAAQKAARQVDLGFTAPRHHFQRRARENDDFAAASAPVPVPDAPSASQPRESRPPKQNRQPKSAPDEPPDPPPQNPLPVSRDEETFPRLAAPAAPLTLTGRLVVGPWAGRATASNEHEWPSLAGPAPAPASANPPANTRRKRNGDSQSARTGVWTVGLPRTGANEHNQSSGRPLSGWNVRVKVDASANAAPKRNDKAKRNDDKRLQNADDDCSSFVRLGRDVNYDRREVPSESDAPKSEEPRSRTNAATQSLQQAMASLQFGSDEFELPKRSANAKRKKHNATKAPEPQSSAPAPPGLPGASRAAVPPPPGFDWFDMKPVAEPAAPTPSAASFAFVIPSGMFTVRVDDEFTYEVGQRLKHALENGSRQSSNASGELAYLKTPDFQQRNKLLIEAIRRALMRDDESEDSAATSSKYDRFKLQSNKFRARQISATEYLLHCAQLFETPPAKQSTNAAVSSAWASSAAQTTSDNSSDSRTELAILLPELLSLLPDVARQHELLLAVLSNGLLRKKESKALMQALDLRLVVCEQCGQICVPRDATQHTKEHSKQDG